MIRVISWNISCMSGKTSQKRELLQALTHVNDEKRPTVIALQEVTPGVYEELVKDDLFSQHTFSLKHRKPGILEGGNRKLGCLIATTGGVEIMDEGVVERAVFPERASRAFLRWEDKHFEVISFHSLTGVDYKKSKSAHFASLADYLHIQNDKPMILCCDLNEPKIDHIETEKIITHNQKGDGGKAAALLLKPSGVHSMNDAYRLWLNQLPEEKEKLRRMQDSENDLKNSPLAVSYKTSQNGKRRYDYVMVSRHWQIKNVSYLLDEGLLHGSDHAVVVADLDW